MSNQATQQPRYVIVASNKFYGHYDVLDTKTQKREPQGNVRSLENVTTFRDIENEVTDFVTNGFKPGYQIGLPNFDDIFSTYTGQFITVTGIPSSGKSDFVDQMVVGYNANYSWKTAFASPEMRRHIYMLIS